MRILKIIIILTIVLGCVGVLATKSSTKQTDIDIDSSIIVEEQTKSEIVYDNPEDNLQDEQEQVTESEKPLEDEQGIEFDVYYPDSDLMNLESTRVTANIESPQDLLNSWKSYGIITQDVTVISLEENVLDLSVEFQEFIMSMGTSGELLYISALVNTFNEFYGFDEITILIEGNIWETGHNIYDFPFISE